MVVGPIHNYFPRHRYLIQGGGLAIASMSMIGSAFATKPWHILVSIGFFYPFSCCEPCVWSDRSTSFDRNAEVTACPRPGSSRSLLPPRRNPPLRMVSCSSWGRYWKCVALTPFMCALTYRLTVSFLLISHVRWHRIGRCNLSFYNARPPRSVRLQGSHDFARETARHNFLLRMCADALALPCVSSF